MLYLRTLTVELEALATALKSREAISGKLIAQMDQIAQLGKDSLTSRLEGLTPPSDELMATLNSLIALDKKAEEPVSFTIEGLTSSDQQHATYFLFFFQMKKIPLVVRQGSV